MEEGIKSKKWFENRYKQLGAKLISFELKPVIRVNTLKISHKKIQDRLTSLGVKLKKIPNLKDAFRIEKSKFSLGAIKEYLLGYYYLQGEASQLAVEALNPKESDIVLDCCAAPGGKTTQIAQFMNNKGVIVALEKKKPRVPSLLANLERMGITNTIVYNLDAENVEKLNTKFDKILLDVECSGNYIAEPNFFKSRNMETILKNTAIQKTLLRSAVKVLKDDGVIVYSTCSLEPEENELIIDWALRNLNLELIDTGLKSGDPALSKVFEKNLNKSLNLARRFWPFKTKTQGFFIAKLRKKK